MVITGFKIMEFISSDITAFGLALLLALLLGVGLSAVLGAWRK